MKFILEGEVSQLTAADQYVLEALLEASRMGNGESQIACDFPNDLPTLIERGDEVDLEYATNLVTKKYQELELNPGMQNASKRARFNTFLHNMCYRIAGVSSPSQLDHDQLVSFCNELVTVRLTDDGHDFEINLYPQS